MPAPIDLQVPEARRRPLTPTRRPQSDREFVLYWMTSARRTSYNFALQEAVYWSLELDRPLVIFEPLRCGYRWASDRLHSFVLDGMASKLEAVADRATYLPYVERELDEGSGLLEWLARRACVVVADDYPCFFLPAMIAAAARRVDTEMVAVDSNGLMPMRATDKVFHRAYDFRRHLQKCIGPHLLEIPERDPLAALPQTSRASFALPDRWSALTADELLRPAELLGTLPIDHRVQPSSRTRGGEAQARARLDEWLANSRASYSDLRNHPDESATSGLAPFLHFGQLSAHEVFVRLAEAEGWTPERLGDIQSGARAGFWSMSESSEAFLDQIVTWRELGFNRCALTQDYDQYDSLPPWSLETLEEHKSDPREFVYTEKEFEESQTHDEIWNAAQTELRETGVIHNYLRMLWGKKILEWSETPRDALRTMIDLNNRFALDGRDPNSYSGIFWCLGRYDRAWGPQRPIFGKVRFMSSQNTRRKLRLNAYLESFGNRQLSLLQ